MRPAISQSFLLCLLWTLCHLPVSTVHAQSSTNFPERRLQLIRDIGGDGNIFARIEYVVETPNGTLFVLDGSERNIKMFDSRGTHLRSISRQGSGPGELIGPSFTMRRTSAGIAVTDHMLRRDLTFSEEGKHLHDADGTACNGRNCRYDCPDSIRTFPLRNDQTERTFSLYGSKRTGGGWRMGA